MTMVSSKPILPPNLLGSPRAEADPLLASAFVQTPDYRAIAETQAYNFVVGRRGTGKSAIFIHARDQLRSEPTVFLLASTPTEHASLEFQRILEKGKEYRLMRAAASLAWSGHLLYWIAEQLLDHRLTLPSQPELQDLTLYHHVHRNLFDEEPADRFVEILKRGSQVTTDSASLPKAVADMLRLADLRRFVESALRRVACRVVLLYDGLDEGWEPSATACAALGGLAKALSDFADAHVPIHGTAFVRDNMIRALFAFDDDFSRHIEGSTLRLTWDEASLLHLVTNRLRITLSREGTENDVRVWDALVDSSLSGRDGFARCLENTLLRPRDILVLLNSAALFASRAGRAVVSLDDINRASSEISQGRLSDLLKEYQRVLPGFRSLVYSFSGRPAVSRLAAVLPRLQEALTATPQEAGSRETEFPLLEASQDAFQAMFAVGFLGVRQRDSARYQFCHDGSGSGVEAVSGEAEVMVHPCYWKALDVRDAGLDAETLSEVTDEDENIRPETIINLRTAQIGRLVDELDHIPLGREGSREFEAWAHKITRMLFAPRLDNFELKPNPGAIAQRDIVATIAADSGFWARVNRDYGTRQVVIEVKNYDEPTPTDLRQVLAYATNEYGRFGLLVVRSNSEGLPTAVKNGLKELYHVHDRVVLVIASCELTRCVRKFRKLNRFDYTEELLKKKLDMHVRRTVAIRPRD